MSDPTRKRPILTGFDGSETARGAVTWAAAEAARRDTRLLVARAYERPINVTDLSWTPVGLLERLPTYTHRDTAVRRLARDCLTTHPDLAVETTIRAGHPSDVLATLADETDAELVVLGAAEHGPIARLVLGSVAADMVHHVARPVIAVRRTEVADPQAPVLLGLAGVPEDGPAVEFAFDFAKTHNVALHAVHASNNRAAQAGSLLAPWRERYANVRVHIEVLADKPAHALVEKSRTARLLIVGCHHHKALHRMLQGSVSHTSLYHAACPVAIIPTGTQKGALPPAHPGRRPVRQHARRARTSFKA
jgi:nucleotide-binding universal stress UspA family protein